MPECQKCHHLQEDCRCSNTKHTPTPLMSNQNNLDLITALKQIADFAKDCADAQMETTKEYLAFMRIRNFAVTTIANAEGKQ